MKGTEPSSRIFDIPKNIKKIKIESNSFPLYFVCLFFCFFLFGSGFIHSMSWSVFLSSLCMVERGGYEYISSLLGLFGTLASGQHLGTDWKATKIKMKKTQKQPTTHTLAYGNNYKKHRKLLNKLYGGGGKCQALTRWDIGEQMSASANYTRKK